MLRAVALSMCLILPTAAFAQDPAPPSADQPSAPENQALVPPADAQPQPQQAVENARWCGAHGGCNGKGSGKGWIVLTGVAGTVVTAVAVGVAVGLATRNNNGAATP